MKGAKTMGWILVIIGIVIDYFIFKGTVNTYRDMKKAKHKAEIWGAKF